MFLISYYNNLISKCLGILCLSLISTFCFAQGRIIIHENFDYPDGKLPDNWWSEGCTGTIKYNHLFVDADTCSLGESTIWLNNEFGGDFSIEFDTHVIASERKANNINCFLLYSDSGEKSLKETAGTRTDAAYKKYHTLNGLIITCVANGNEDTARVRLRINPGFHLLAENYGYRCKPGETYHIQIIKRKNNLQYWIDQVKMIDEKIDTDDLLDKGYFGFRTWRTALWWDNLVIRQLE